MSNLYELDALSVTELLALALGRKVSSSTVTELVAAYETPRSLLNATAIDLQAIKGIGEIKASQLKAGMELGRRLQCAPKTVTPVINCPGDAANLVMQEMRFLDREHFKTLSLNTKNCVIKVDTVAIGTLNSCIIHPREVFKTPIKVGANSIILVHNHPSGDITPSQEDLSVTKRLIEAGKLIGIEVLDHIIIGDGLYLSFKEKEII